MSAQACLSEKDKQFREFALHDSMWHVVLYVGLPLALYQSLTQLFKIFDSMMAAHISATAVSAVSYLSQINLMLSAIGGGLAVGASIKISEAYGGRGFPPGQAAGQHPLCHVRHLRVRTAGRLSPLHSPVPAAGKDPGGIHRHGQPVFYPGAVRHGDQLF